MRKPHTPHITAVFFAITAYTIWMLGDVFIKMARMGTDVPPAVVVAVFGFGQAFFIILASVIQGKTKALCPHKWKPQAGRAFLGVGTNFLVVIALKHIALTDFYMIFFTSPFVVAVLGAVVLREFMSLKTIFALLVGFSGVFIALAPWEPHPASHWLGYGAVAGAVIVGSVDIVWRRFMTATETPQSMALFAGLAACGIGSAIALPDFVMPPLWVVALLLVVGFTNLCADLCHFRALKRAPAATVSHYHYTQIVIGGLLGYLIWHEQPTLALMIGAAMIIASGLYVASAGKQNAEF